MAGLSRTARLMLDALDAPTEYWTVIVYHGGNAKAGSLQTLNAQRALDSLIRRGLVVLDKDGYCLREGLQDDQSN